MSLIKYRVAPGVTRINAKPVDGNTIRLTEREALYDLAHGRLLPPPAVPEAKTNDGD